MDKYKFVESIKNNEKVIFYGEEAILLGADNMLLGFFVNIWLASTYKEDGDLNRACEHFKKAKTLQNFERKNVINKELLLQEKLGEDFPLICQKREQESLGAGSGQAKLLSRMLGDAGRCQCWVWLSQVIDIGPFLTI